MKKYKSSETEEVKEDSIEEIEIISKEIVKKNRLCNSCRSELPENLDNGLCPFCGIRN